MRPFGGASELWVGALVQSLGNRDLGIGKVARVHDRRAVIEYFDSVANPVAARIEVAVERVVIARLDRQLRVYFRAGRHWRVGRVMEEEFARVRVRPPGDAEDLWLGVEDLFVRWDRPLEDPVGVMQARALETPYYYFARRAFVDALLQEDAACRGYRALTSSAIEIYDHQVAVANRVLADPVRRYLLADEVGMGKTIEAGLVIRQQLLDHPEAVVRVVAPTRMCHQWWRELRDRFFVDDAPLSTVEVVRTLDDAAWRVSRSRPAPDLLVIDEAHHVARWAHGDKSLRERFGKVAAAAHSARDLLLLSATPVAHNEATFLAMLHLLDPDNYDLSDIEKLKERVRNRHELAQAFVLFRPGQSYRRMSRRESHLRELLRGDPEGLERLDYLLAAGPDAEQPELDQRIRALRVAISDRHRIHYRMLRNRRDDAEDFPVRGRCLGRVLDCGVAEATDLVIWLDRWRNALVADFSRDGQVDWQPITQLMFDRALAFPSILLAAARRRLGSSALGNKAQLVGLDNEVFTGRAPGTEERAALHELLDLDTPAIEQARLQTVLDFVWSIPRRQKVVIFSSFIATAHHVAGKLTELLAPGQVNRHVADMPLVDSEAALRTFRETRDCNVLVCDASAEEGLNLQFADILVHLDLPLDPNRLEQRIGRLDRHGPDTPVENVVLRENVPGSYGDAWFDVLNKGFQVFDRSISAFQYVVDALQPELLTAFVEDGPEGPSRIAETIPERLEAERREIAIQDQMDAIEAIELTHPVADAIRQQDDEWEQMQSSHEALICEGKGHLRFTRRIHFADTSLYSYWAADPLRGGEPLVPTRDLTAFMLGALSEDGNVRHGSHERAASLRTPGTRVWRAGDSFLDGLLRYVRERDDRGRAYGLWRVVPDLGEGEIVAGLRFDILVQAGDVRPHREDDESSRVMQRRAYNFLPPLIDTVWVAPDLKEMADPRWLSRMRAKYSPKFGDSRLGPDRWDAVEAALPAIEWEAWCADGRRFAEEVVRSREAVVARVRAASHSAQRDALARVEALRTRQKLNDDADDALLFEAHALEAVRDAVEAPRLVIDAIGLIILAPHGPGSRP